MKYGKPASQVAAIRSVLGFLRRLYGSTAAREFSPKKLKAVRDAMVTQKIVRKFKLVDPATGSTRWVEKTLPHGMARRTINKQIGRLKRLFGWAVEEELVEVTVHAALLRVRGLRRHETEAREKARIRPVPKKDVESVLPLLPPVIRAMVEVQLMAGARPQDVVFMRPDDIDRSGSVWEYRPRRYKTEYHNPDADPDRDHVVFLGPRAQEVLQPFLSSASEGYLFSPRVSEEARNDRKRRLRRSPMTPSQAARRPRGRSLMKKKGKEQHAHYGAILRKLATGGGMLGVIFHAAENKIRDPAKLTLLIVELIDKEQWTQLDADVKGDAYEGLMEKNAQDTKSGAGQYFTPRPLIRAIVEVVAPQPGEVICDPACGTCGFLLVAHDYIRQQNPKLIKAAREHLRLQAFRGKELVAAVTRLGAMNLLLHGIGPTSDEVDPPISTVDSLAEDSGDRFDVVLTNPPFGKRSSVTVRTETGDKDRQSITVIRDDFWASTSNKQLNFVQHVHTILKPGGRAALVIPDNVLFEGGPGEVI